MSIEAMNEQMKPRLTRPPLELRYDHELDDDEYWSKRVILAGRGDEMALDEVIDYYLWDTSETVKGRRYSRISRLAWAYEKAAKKRGLRIYADDFEEAMQSALHRAAKTYTGRDINEFEKYLTRALKNACRDVYRRKMSRKERHNTTAASIDALESEYGYEVADESQAGNPEVATMNAELLRIIREAPGIEDTTRRAALLYFEGRSLREVATAVGLSDPKQVQRRLHSLQTVLHDFLSEVP